MTRISTHVLDVVCGRPAAGIAVALARREHGAWRSVSVRITDQDGRISNFFSEGEELQDGLYRLRFRTLRYFRKKELPALHPFVDVHCRVRSGDGHYHIPLLISPHSYSTYRGS